MAEDTIAQQNIATVEAAANQPKSFITDRNQLVNPAIYETFHDLIDKIIDQNNGEEALKMRFLLEDMLLGYYPELKSEAPELYPKYRQLIALLKFLTLSARPFADIEELIKNHLLDAIKAKVRVHEKFLDVLEIYDDVREEGKIAESLGKAMLASASKIGSDRITVGGKEVLPTLGNWLADYDKAFLKNSPGPRKRGAIERITYANQNTSFQKLPEPDRKLLLICFELYDWLKFGSPFKYSIVVNPLEAAKVTPAGLSIDKLKDELQVGRPVSLSKPLEAQAVAPKISVPGLAAQVIKPGAEANLPQAPVKMMPALILPVKSLPIPPSFSKPMPKPAVASQVQTIDDIKFIDDLKKIGASHLGRGDLKSQISNLKSKIAYLAAVNNLYPHEAVAVFEQSPLFKLYLRIGGMLIGNSNPDRKAAFEEITSKLKAEHQEVLTLSEFEAVADLKKQIESV